jgi:hypothetical protein
MSGTPTGWKKAEQTIRSKFESEEAYKEWRKQIGAVGGSKSRGGGFASDVVGDDGLTGKQRAAIAGAKGGSVSKRTR